MILLKLNVSEIALSMKDDKDEEYAKALSALKAKALIVLAGAPTKTETKETPTGEAETAEGSSKDKESKPGEHKDEHKDEHKNEEQLEPKAGEAETKIAEEHEKEEQKK